LLHLVGYLYYWQMGFNSVFKGLNAELNPICHLLALLGAHRILHVSKIRVKLKMSKTFPALSHVNVFFLTFSLRSGSGNPRAFRGRRNSCVMSDVEGILEVFSIFHSLVLVGWLVRFVQPVDVNTTE